MLNSVVQIRHPFILSKHGTGHVPATGLPEEGGILERPEGALEKAEGGTGNEEASFSDIVFSD